MKRDLYKDLEVVYVAGPITSATQKEEDRRILNAVKAGTILYKEGKTPFIPHQNTHDFYLFEDFSWEDYLKMDLPILKRCDSIYMLKDWEHSKGARIELEHAKKWKLKIYYQEGR